MASATSIPAANDKDTGGKGVWVEPIVMRIDIGEAEAGDGSGPDGGFIS